MYELLQEDDRDDNDGGSDDEGARGCPREWSGDVAFDGFDKESAFGFGNSIGLASAMCLMVAARMPVELQRSG